MLMQQIEKEAVKYSILTIAYFIIESMGYFSWTSQEIRGNIFSADTSLMFPKTCIQGCFLFATILALKILIIHQLCIYLLNMSDEKSFINDKINQVCVSIKSNFFILKRKILDAYQESQPGQISIFLRSILEAFNEDIFFAYVYSVQQTAAEHFQKKVQYNQKSGQDSSVKEDQGADKISKILMGSIIGQADQAKLQKQKFNRQKDNEELPLNIDLNVGDIQKVINNIANINSSELICFLQRLKSKFLDFEHSLSKNANLDYFYKRVKRQQSKNCSSNFSPEILRNSKIGQLKQMVSKTLKQEKFVSVQEKQINNFLNKYFEPFDQRVANNAQQKIKQNISTNIQENAYKEISPVQHRKTQSVIIRKQREAVNDQQISKDRRYKRSIFYNCSIRDIMDKAQTTEKEIQQIRRLLLEKQDLTNLDKLGQLSKYRKQIEQLKQSLGKINQYFERRERECFSLKQIIRLKLTTLKVVHIQYQPKLYKYGYLFDQYRFQSRYSISAFELFKVVHFNKLLTYFTIKGVIIQKFEEFTNKLNHISQIQQSQKTWIINFNPSKILKLSIQVLFNLKIYGISNNDFLPKMKDFMYFKSFFNQLSDITVEIYFEKVNLLNQWGIILAVLRQIKNITIQIYGKYDNDIDALLFKSGLLQLSIFRQITHISFKDITISEQTTVNDLSTMKKSLKDIFTNNAVTHLELVSCKQFPALPKITTLESIHLSDVQFKQHFDLNMLIEDNPLLKSINLSWMLIQKIRLED